MNLELAADYLVMAAWLAYLKSRLILPQPPNVDGEPTADEMAERFATLTRTCVLCHEAYLHDDPRVGR